MTATVLYLLGMVVVVGENPDMKRLPLLALCVLWPVAAVSALVLGTIDWVSSK